MLEVSGTGLRSEIYTTLLRLDIYRMCRNEGQIATILSPSSLHGFYLKKKKSLYYFMNKSHCKPHKKEKERERKGEF